MTREVKFAQVLKQLVEEKYRRNRAGLAAKAHISPSAISQYVAGRATPSMDVLVHLSDILDVTLDYLVLGRETTNQPELGYLTGQLEAHVRTAHVQAEALHDLTARIGHETGDRLGAQIATMVRAVARDLVAEGVSLAGTLSADDVVAIERCDRDATIVTSDLSSEIVVLEQEGIDDTAAAGFFAQVLVENIAAGKHYEYLVPNRSSLRQAASLLRHELVRLSKLDPEVVDRRVRINHVSHACVPGYVVHHVNLEELQVKAPRLLEQTARFVHPDPEKDNLGYLAIVTPASPSYQRYCLIARDEIPHVLAELRAIRQKAT